MEKQIKTIGVLTSGGDAPGMNAAVRAVVRTGLHKGFRMIGIQRGYNGLLNGECFEMNLRSVSNIISAGGTILYTARCLEFKTKEGQDKGAAKCRELGIDALVVIGGDGSYRGARELAHRGIPMIGLPGTIDNDIACTDYTIGYDTAMNTALEMIDKLRDTTQSHDRCSVVEVMGRNAGWLTAAAALAKSDDCEGVDMICLPEVPFNVERFVEKVRVMQEKKPSIVIAVSEGVKLEDGRYVCELADDVHAVDAFGHKALTGTARYLANVVARNLDTKTRCIELSTLQRCAGHLTSRTDITEAYQVGGAAAKAAFEGVTGQMVALKRISNSPYQCTTELHPISEVANLEKKVPLSWMNANHTQMTDEFLAYARPLIQAELTPLYIAGLPHHIYMKNQK